MSLRKILLAALIIAVIGNAADIPAAHSGEISEFLYPLCSEEGLWGFVDEDGDWRIEPQWYAADTFQGNGYAKVVLAENEYTDGIIDIDGNYIVPPCYAVFNNDRGQYYGGINDGIMWVFRPDGAAAFFYVKNGFLSDFVFSADTDPYVTESDLILSVIENGSEYQNAGYINRNDGNVEIPYLYCGEWCLQFVNGYAAVGLYNEAISGIEMQLINEKGDRVDLPDYVSVVPDAHVSEQLVAVQDTDTGLFGYYHVEEKRISIACQYEKIGNFRSGYASASEDGELWGHIDCGGQWIVEPEFPASGSYEFLYDRAIVRTSDEQLIINTAGDIIARIPLDATGIILNNSAVFVYEEDYGNKLFPCALINDAGSYVIPFEKGYAFDSSVCYDGALFPYSLQALAYNGQYGFVDLNGNAITDFAFDYAKNYYHESAYVEQGEKAFYIRLGN